MVVLYILNPNARDICQKTISLILFGVRPMDATEAFFGILCSQVANGKCLILANINRDYFLLRFYILKNLIKE